MSSKSTYSILYMDAGSSGQGGSFVSLGQMLDLLAASGHQLHVILWNASPFEERYRASGAKVVRIYNPIYTTNKNKLLKIYNALTALLYRRIPSILVGVELFLQYVCYRRVLRYAKENSIDLIHLNNQPIRNFIGFWLAKKLKIPVLSHLRTLHGYGLTSAHIKFMKKLCCHMIAVSNASFSYWHQQGIPKEWISVLQNPYDGMLLERNFSKKQYYSLVCISRLENGKGLFFLIKGFYELLKKDSQFTLTLIGDGTLKEELQALVNELGIQQQVKFLGYVQNAKELLPQFDALLFLSEQEGFGRVALEGMAAGIPVIASNVDGINEIVQNQYNGLLIEPNNTDHLVTAVLMLNEQAELAETLIKNGYQTVKTAYAADHFQRQLTTVYDDLMESLNE